jgi:ABC-type transport system involved in multi-copper enzyme maturation permease subunit
MRSIGVIALNTFRESLRDKILYSLLVFASFLIGSSTVLGKLTINEHDKIVTDAGLAAINIVGVIIAIFVGIGLVSKEIERRTIYTIMARPVSRSEFLLGKYLGLVTTLAVNVALMVLVYLGVLALNRSPILPSLLQAVELMFVEMLIVTAAALLFSSFTTPSLSAMFTVGMFVLGHLMSDVRGIAEKSSNEVLKMGVLGLYYLSPNLEMFNIKGQAAAGVSVLWSYQATATAYGLLYSCLLLAIACAIFERRDF